VTENLKTFNASVRYLSPEGGTVYVSAADEAEARERVNDLFKDFNGVEIVYMEEIKESQLELDLRHQQDRLQEQVNHLTAAMFSTPDLDDDNIPEGELN